MRTPLIVLTLLLTACGGSTIKSPDMDTIKTLPSRLEKQLAFTCAYEKDRAPPRQPEAEQLFQHARWLQKKNRLKNDPAKYPAFERLYRIAAAWGHDKAAHNLLLMLMRGQSASTAPVTEGVDLVQGLVDRGLPLGYYDMGVLLYQGYGVEGNEGLALQYMRHAADLGSPDAQYYIGDKLNGLTMDYPVPFKIGDDMKRCAAEQGHAEAALETGTALKLDKKYPEALKYYQLAVKAGDEVVAYKLRDSFLAPPVSEELTYLSLEKDEERSRRYEIISDILGRYSYLNPTVDDIDAIVPLPPAKLPPWDGQIKWVKDWESNVPPPLPSEERIVEMAKAKGLDPATGLPLAAPAQAAAAPDTPPPAMRAAATLPAGTTVASGQSCPQAGLWQCAHPAAAGGPLRYFIASEILLPVLVPVGRSLWQRLTGAPRLALQDTVWTLQPADSEGKHGA